MHKRTAITAALITFVIVGGIVIYLISIPNDHKTGALRKATRTPTATAVTATTSVDSTSDQTLLTLARQYIDAINRDDETAIAQLNCSRRAPGLLQIATGGQAVQVTGEIERSPDRERAYVHLTIGGLPGPQLTVEKRNGAWCVRD